MEKETFPDATVVAASRKYIWVEVNRDHTPDIPKHFGVMPYPHYIVLNKDEDKIFRFEAYMRPAEFLTQLREADERYALYKAGKEWDTPNPRPEKICDVGTVTTLKAPSEDRPAGIAFLKGEMWVSQGGVLYQYDMASFKAKKSYKIEASVSDITSDGEVLYAVDHGWTAGFPIYVIDPKTGTTIRQIVTAAKKGGKVYAAAGIAWRNGRLYIIESGRPFFYELDPKTGDIVRTFQGKKNEMFASNLAFDGENFVVGNRTHLLLVSPETGEVLRRVPLNYRLTSVAYFEGSYYLMEQPVRGFNKKNEPIRIWPREIVIYKLTLPPQQDQKPGS